MPLDPAVEWNPFFLPLCSVEKVDSIINELFFVFVFFLLMGVVTHIVKRGVNNNLKSITMTALKPQTAISCQQPKIRLKGRKKVFLLLIASSAR